MTPKNYLKTLIGVFRSSASPLNFIFPLPVFQFLVSSQYHDLTSLHHVIAFSFTFYPAVNLWNHVNDVKEDTLSGRYNVFAERGVKKLGVILVLMLYAISFFILLLKFNTVKFVLFMICFTIAWMYSDRMTLGKFIGRFKDHYVTEFLSFLIFFPALILLFCTFFGDINERSFALAISIMFLMLYNVFLKDLKDITGDEKAGLKTLGVVFSPRILLRCALISVFLYYVTVAVSIVVGVFPVITSIVLLPLIPFVYLSFKLRSYRWSVSLQTVKYIQYIMPLNVTSLILFIISSFLSQA